MPMTETIIQIREEEKSFAKSHLSEILNVGPSTISRWIKIGKLPSPSGHNGKFSKKDIEAIFEIFRHVPITILSEEGKQAFNELMDSSIIIEGHGVFNISPKAIGGIQRIQDMIKEYGLWNAQGMNNHEHMKEYIKNPILQMLLAKNWLIYG
jgi:hypothetical protein